ncbi:MAG: phosphoglycerate mutase, partial [Firmicutes bacterium]|nr:phosphoglycerate mutase [Bacillota bacterium]
EHLPKGENSDVLYGLMKKSVEILKNHPVNLDRIKRGLRPATSMWIWGEGSKTVLPTFESLYNVKGAVVSAVDLIKGIGASAKLTVAEVEGATGNIHTNFDGKAQASLELLKDNDFLYVHLEAPDECSHQGDMPGKIKSLEMIDEKVVGPVIDYLKSTGEDFRFLIVPDHQTPLSIRTHKGRPVPYVFFDSAKSQTEEESHAFNEVSGASSGIFFANGFELTDHFFAE